MRSTQRADPQIDLPEPAVLCCKGSQMLAPFVQAVEEIEREKVHVHVNRDAKVFLFLVLPEIRDTLTKSWNNISAVCTQLCSELNRNVIRWETTNSNPDVSKKQTQKFFLTLPMPWLPDSL